MKKKRVIALAMAVALTMVSMAGCGGESSSDSGSSNTESTADDSQKADDVQESAEVTEETGTESTGDKYGGTVTICYPGQEAATCFLPFSTSTGDRFAVAPALESLGRQDKDGNTYGWLAKSISADKDTLTATIVLNEGIKFSDNSVYLHKYTSLSNAGIVIAFMIVKPKCEKNNIPISVYMRSLIANIVNL